MQCLACHEENEDGVRFCAKCGAPLPVKKNKVDPLIGKTIAGRYQITDVLGEGGMGRVYAAEQKMGTSVRKVAVKTLLAQFAKDPQTVARFMREVGTVSELEHPNTIKVYDFGQMEDDGDLYIAMELLQGMSLEKALAQEGALAPERVERILGQVCGSLQEAHDKKIVHRDLKPANIFLTTRAGEEDVVKVLDFGIAKRDSKHTPMENLTKQGTILGTPPYMSPEQFTGKPLDARSDLYSLAVVAYEMLTGRLPYEASSPWEWMTAHMTLDPIPFENAPNGASIPEKMKSAVLRALSKHPEQRPSTARELFEDLSIGDPRLSAVGLGAGGVAGMGMRPTPVKRSSKSGPKSGSKSGPRAATTGEPATVQATVVGTAPAIAKPAPTPKQGGATNLLIGLVVLLGLGGAIGWFLVWKSSQPTGPSQTAEASATADASAAASESPVASAIASASESAVESSTESASASVSASASESASASASGIASTKPSTTPTTRPTTSSSASTKPSASASTQPSASSSASNGPPKENLDACCAAQRDAKKKRACDRINVQVRSGTITRAAGLARLRGEDIRCR